MTATNTSKLKDGIGGILQLIEASSEKFDPMGGIRIIANHMQNISTIQEAAENHTWDGVLDLIKMLNSLSRLDDAVATNSLFHIKIVCTDIYGALS